MGRSRRGCWRRHKSSAPDWLSTERDDITAKIGPELVEQAKTDPNLTPKLVQALLENRFKLKLHREAREMAIYALVLRKPGDRARQVQDFVDPWTRDRRQHHARHAGDDPVDHVERPTED